LQSLKAAPSFCEVPRCASEQVLEHGSSAASADRFEALSLRWKGPEWIREQFTSRGYRAHLLYREMREAILRKFGQPVDFVDEGDRSARAYFAGQGVPYDTTHAGSRYINERHNDLALRVGLEEMWAAVSAEKESEFAKRGLETTGWTGLQGAVMPLLEPLLAKAGYARTRMKLRSEHAAIRMIRPLGECFALYCSATLTWTHVCDVALPTDIYLVTTSGERVDRWMPIWLLRDLEAYRLFGGTRWNTALNGTQTFTSTKAAVVGVHAFADWATLLAESFSE
jgi:hypothetical protein